jgi:hypothetical protein
MHRVIRHPHVQRLRIGVRINGHRAHPHPTRSPNDPTSDFAAIGDQK